MKNKEDEPKEYFERNILLVAVVALSGLALFAWSVQLLLDVNPWGSATAIPGLILCLQGLWLIVNPYVVIYDDRFEVKQSLFYNKQFYYLDTKGFDEKTNELIYNDEDREKLSLFGIRNSHQQAFKKRLNEKINESLQKRDF